MAPGLRSSLWPYLLHQFLFRINSICFGIRTSSCTYVQHVTSIIKNIKMVAFLLSPCYVTLSQVLYLYCLMLSGPEERAFFFAQGNWRLEIPYGLYKATSLANIRLWFKAGHAQTQNSTVATRSNAECHAQRIIYRGHLQKWVLSHLYICSFPETSTDPILGSKGAIWNSHPVIAAAGLQEDVQTSWSLTVIHS